MPAVGLRFRSTICRIAHAGEAIDLSFVARAHGRTPFDLPPGEATFVFADRATGQSLVATAAPSGLAPGHHRAKIVLPSAGTWQWELRPYWYPPVQYGPLTVLSAAVRSTPVPGSTTVALALAGSLLLAAATTALALRDRRRRPLWLGTLGSALLVALASGQLLSGETATVEAQAAASSRSALVARGQALFAAKGCISCHHHGALPGSTISGIGPDVTHYAGSAEFLRPWLANPRAVKTGTQMPDLGLQAAEIDALAAFLTQ